jgi:hypothetical protein
MAKDIDLHLFREDVRAAPPPGSNAPPVTIRARDLDGNYKKVTLLKGDGSPPLYEVEYTEDGTRITRILPKGENKGDLLYWDGENWKVFSAFSGSGLRVLTIEDNELAWTQTEDC